MKYYEADFSIHPLSQDARDILAALAAEAGFETFEDTDGGLRGYVQQEAFDRQTLDETLRFFPMADTNITYKVSEAEDRDWNEQWEQEGFEPIVIGNGKMIIHDGRHLPTETTGTQSSSLHVSTSMQASSRTPILIEIDARLAFGTGTHETTQMICETLLEMSLDGRLILDAGCGTGILGIAALRLGADSVTAYDIDEWSVENTRHNAVINQVDERMTILHGDATLFDATEQRYDCVLANINRNILLQDMTRFRQVMTIDGTLVMSGFFTEDIPLLEEKGKELGLSLIQQKQNNQWATIVMKVHRNP